MTATPCSVKSVASVKSESLNGSWIEIQEENKSPFHFIKNNGRESKNSSFEKIMMDVQNELIQLSMSSNSSCKDQLQQINQKLSSRASESPPLQVDAQQLDQLQLDQLEKFDDEQFQNLKSDLLWYWQQDDCKNFFDDKKTDQLNLRQWMVRRGIFNKEVLSLLVLSNVVSVVLGVGIGYTALIRSFRG